jgi:hypothetical protein
VAANRIGFKTYRSRIVRVSSAPELMAAPRVFSFTSFDAPDADAELWDAACGPWPAWASVAGH